MRTNNNGIIWTVKMIERFKQLCEDPNLTYQKIANTMSKEFGGRFTKNSCIGKARRLKLAAPLTSPSPDLTIYQLRNRHCKWPLGPTMQQPPYAYCGKLTVLGCSYCRAHMARAHAKPTAYSAKIYLRS
jgi:hypothetical protein